MTVTCGSLGDDGLGLPSEPCQQSLTSYQLQLGSLFRMELEADTYYVATSALKSNARVCAAKERVHASSPAGGDRFTSLLAADVQNFLLDTLLQGQSEAVGHTVLALASRLSSVGYRLSVRNALGGGGPSCFKNLRHEFLLVHGADEFEGGEYVVDLHFRDQFLIPQPTSAYLEVLSVVPQEFVGPVSRLVPVVQDLCSAMADSFEDRDLTLPPWRRTQSMLSKWTPSKVKDRLFNCACPSEAAGARWQAYGSSSSSSSCCRPLPKQRLDPRPCLDLPADSELCHWPAPALVPFGNHPEASVPPPAKRESQHRVEIGFSF